MNVERFRLPAEFEPHRATWLLWPTRADNWRSEAYFAQNDTLALAALIAHFEPVRLGAPASLGEDLRRRVPPNVEVVAIEFNDTWVRDTGPTTLVSEDGALLAIDWKFNSWGGLFNDSSADDTVAEQIAQHEHLPIVRAPIVLEGGAVLADGHGTIIVTEESVLADNRNPGLTRGEAERVFRSCLNATKVVWVPEGLAHDESGGHIDNVCAFASPRTILVAGTDDIAHPSFERLREAKRILTNATNSRGQAYEVVDMPLPDPMVIETAEAACFAAPHGTIVRTAGAPLAPSHVNLYVTEGAVFVPTFNTRTDRAALDVVRRAFPHQQIVPFPCREFLLGGGGVHCLTKEVPA